MKPDWELACRDSAYEHALAYAKERVQSAPVWEMKNPDAKAVTIINHPDVRKKLLWMKSHIEGLRSLLYFSAFCMDMSRVAKTEEEKGKWEGYLDLMTPVVKAYTTDKGLLICSLGMDVYGGYGYCQEYPAEQYMRDEKIATIYEGTNGIQSLDLVGRKLGQKKGANVMNMAAMIQGNYTKLKANPELGKVASTLEEACNAWIELTMFFAQAGKSGDFLLPVLNACKYLELFGDVLIGHFLLDGAGVAFEKLEAIYEAKGADSLGKKKGLLRSDSDAAFYSGRIASAKYFANEILTTVKARCEAIKAGDKSPLEMVDEAFTC
jgi:hypothetical protein